MISPERINRIVDVELSRRGRLGHVVLLLCATAMTIGIVTLWATETGLPLRTRAAFALMTLIGVAWIVYAAWVLTTRSVLLAHHRIVAAWMAIIFSTAFTALFALIGYSGQLGSMPYIAAAVESAFVAVGIVFLVRARRRFADLLARRDALQQVVP